MANKKEYEDTHVTRCLGSRVDGFLDSNLSKKVEG